MVTFEEARATAITRRMLLLVHIFDRNLGQSLFWDQQPVAQFAEEHFFIWKAFDDDEKAKTILDDYKAKSPFIGIFDPQSGYHQKLQGNCRLTAANFLEKATEIVNRRYVRTAVDTFRCCWRDCRLEFVGLANEVIMHIKRNHMAAPAPALPPSPPPSPPQLPAPSPAVAPRELALQQRLEDLENMNQQLAQENERLKVELRVERQKYLDRVSKDEAEKRALRNQILELKGNIRVFCRVRPILSEELGLVTALTTVSFPDNDEKRLNVLKPDKNNNNRAIKYPFEFDYVFGPKSTQKDVFEEVSPLVQSAIDGYNVCIFAYGQTGSGKTFTMEGPPPASNHPEQYGIIELSASKIFETLRTLAADGWEYTVEASFVEIYNETVLDLLAKDPTKSNDKLEIKMVAGASGGNIVDVAGLTRHDVTSINELKPLLETAQRNRTTAGTKCNDRSSRSHSVFRLRLCGENAARGVPLEGMVNLVDLGGSECLKKSGSEGVQAEEAKNINRSLMTLGKVIMALVNGDNHIPYRESKLTYLLQNSLGGNSRTLMFVNINPETDSVNETLSSLRFATEANQCHLGTATKNVVSTKG